MTNRKEETKIEKTKNSFFIYKLNPIKQKQNKKKKLDMGSCLDILVSSPMKMTAHMNISSKMYIGINSAVRSVVMNMSLNRMIGNIESRTKSVVCDSVSWMMMMWKKNMWRLVLNRRMHR